ncbi:hypothetical protein CTI12_AA561940 [Artemisia annua]|uniref:Uncharacterized protein n=1 Tax=Artemisia annua TaxID=35608 RepID=A0A2U1KUU6_ARTAN|nr:hypothetical protein CTI12_AA561940 [Artemisia annua]
MDLSTSSHWRIELKLLNVGKVSEDNSPTEQELFPQFYFLRAYCTTVEINIHLERA